MRSREEVVEEIMGDEELRLKIAEAAGLKAVIEDGFVTGSSTGLGEIRLPSGETVELQVTVQSDEFEYVNEYPDGEPIEAGGEEVSSDD